MNSLISLGSYLVESRLRKRMNWCPSIPLGSLERLVHLHIQHFPGLPHPHTRDEEHDLITSVSSYGPLGP
jgi:hypothetical protein